MDNLTKDGSARADKGQCCNIGEQDRALNKAIELTSAENLRWVLKNLSRKSPSVKQILEEELFVVEENCDEDPDGGKSGETQHSCSVLGPECGANKRLRPRYVTCEQCNDQVYVTLNDEWPCIWHDGELDWNSAHKTWWDWDRYTYGDPDTDENRGNYPEGFLWSCCNKDGYDEGCINSPHKFRES
jgi:hypothetical protein